MIAVELQWSTFSGSTERKDCKKLFFFLLFLFGLAVDRDTQIRIGFFSGGYRHMMLRTFFVLFCSRLDIV